MNSDQAGRRSPRITRGGLKQVETDLSGLLIHKPSDFQATENVDSSLQRWYRVAVKSGITRVHGMTRNEMANSLSHGLALLLALAMVPVLVLSAVRMGSIHFAIGVSVFGGTVILLYLASTLYHSLTHERAKHFFRLFDHSSIFLLIAGTYTPFALGVLRGPWGWTLLTIVWVLAVIGIVTKAVLGLRHSWISMTLYLLMGWLAVVAVKPIFLLVPLPGILLILAGGLAYTGGLAFLASRRMRYGHFIWHLFVVAGTTCHFFAVLWYAHEQITGALP